MLSPKPRLKQKLESKSPSWGNKAGTNKQSVAHSEQPWAMPKDRT